MLVVGGIIPFGSLEGKVTTKNNDYSISSIAGLGYKNKYGARQYNVNSRAARARAQHAATRIAARSLPSHHTKLILFSVATSGFQKGRQIGQGQMLALLGGAWNALAKMRGRRRRRRKSKQTRRHSTTTIFFLTCPNRLQIVSHLGIGLLPFFVHP